MFDFVCDQFLLSLTCHQVAFSRCRRPAGGPERFPPSARECGDASRHDHFLGFVGAKMTNRAPGTLSHLSTTFLSFSTTQSARMPYSTHDLAAALAVNHFQSYGVPCCRRLRDHNR